MDSSRTLFVVTVVVSCIISCTFALSDAEIAAFRTGERPYSFSTENGDIYGSFNITTEEYTNKKGTTSYYHYFTLNVVPDYSNVTDYTIWSDKQGGNQKEIAEQDSEKCIPKTGSYRDTPEDAGGLVGFTVSGSQIWYYTTSSGDDAVADEVMDDCGGHASPGGAYHYHGWNDFSTSTIKDGCLYNFDISACPATIVGVALDGFPIYSPQICECVTYASDGSCSEWPSTASDYFEHVDLDDCNGREVDSANPVQSSDVTAEHIYEYRMTADVPYHVGCIMGEYAALAKCGVSSKKRDEEILTKALEHGVSQHLMELREVVDEATLQMEEEEKREAEEAAMEAAKERSATGELKELRSKLRDILGQN